EDIGKTPALQTGADGVIEFPGATVDARPVRSEGHRNLDHINGNIRISQPVATPFDLQRYMTSGAGTPSNRRPFASVWRVAATSTIRIERVGSGAPRIGRASKSA